MNYIKQVIIINFQSHAKSIINLNKGLNIFVGESDQGKTAIIRALRWLFYNEPRGSGFIRAGETYCEVTIIMDNDVQISRIRDESKRINRYVIGNPDGNEEIFEKFKNDVPQEVQNILGIYKLWIDRDKDFEINIARQLESPFLLSETASTRAKVIGRIANLHILDGAQRDVLKDIRSLGRKKSDIEAELEVLAENLKLYDDIEEKEKSVNKIKQIIEIVNYLNDKIIKLQNINDKIKTTHTNISKLEILINNLDKLEISSSILSQIKQLENKLVHINQLQQSYSAKLASYKKYDLLEKNLKGIESVNSNYDKLIDYLSAYKSLSVIHNKITNSNQEIKSLDKLIETTNAIHKGEDIIHKLYELRLTGYKLQEFKKAYDTSSNNYKNISIEINKYKHQENVENIINNLNTNNNFYTKLIELNTKFESVQKDKLNATSNYKKIDDKYNNLVDEYVQLLEDAGICPTCHTEITSEKVNKISESIRSIN